LREELEIANGDQDENETDEQKRSVKIFLKSLFFFEEKKKQNKKFK
jgi:hypothetical protein